MTLNKILNERASLIEEGVTFIEQGRKDSFLSYAQLYHKSLKALGYLQEQKIMPGDELIFQIEDNKTFIIIFWACLLGGIIPVPLSIGRNDEQRNKVFKVWNVLNNPYLVMNRNQKTKFKRHINSISKHSRSRQNILKKTFLTDDILNKKNEGIEQEVDSDQIAFIQFSSGSTGDPKGVVLTHKNLSTNVAAISHAAEYSKNDSLISWMPLTHDMGLIGFHINPLLNGINQYIISTDLFIRRPSVWLDKASEYSATVLSSPNFGYKYLMKHCNVAAQNEWDLSAVRIVYNGAEPISLAICEDFLEVMASQGLKRNAMCPVYGLAEASLAVSISGIEDNIISCLLDRNKLNFGDRISEVNDRSGAVNFVNVGKPINDCLVRITNNRNEPVADQTIGHIQIKGDNVTSGYYNNKEATKAVVQTTGWVKTGDLGFIKEGALYITGREKDIIFIHGQNYYPHDIERVAEQVEGVELNKVVVASHLDHDTGKEEVLVFVYHKQGIEKFIPIVHTLKNVINKEIGIEIDKVLPVRDIPKTTSGKLQRYKLVERYKDGYYDNVELQLERVDVQEVTSTNTVEPPANETEKRLLRIWQRVLKDEGLGVTSPFLSVGGNSLRAAEIEMWVLKEFQLDLPASLIYEKGTVRAVANEITTLDAQRYNPIPKVTSQGQYPLTSAQKPLYYGWEANKNSIAYNIPIALLVDRKINEEKLESCIKKIIARHDVLRMSFNTQAEPYSLLHEGIDFTLEYSKIETNELDKELKKRVRPFDLRKLPLFRVELVEIGQDRHILLLNFHHIISDGISVYHFIEELFQLYDGGVIPSLPASYRDYSHWERKILNSETIKLQQEYWLEQLGGELPILDLPTDFSRPAIFSSSGEKIQLCFNNTTNDKLRVLASRYHCSLSELMFTIYGLLIYTYTRQEDIIIGVPVAGRKHPDILSSQGMFVNNLPVRIHIDKSPSFLDVLDNLKTSFHLALANQLYPFEYLVDQVTERRDPSRNPLFDTMFVYQNMGFSDIKTNDFNASWYSFDPGFSKFDLSIEIIDNGSTLHYGFEYATDLFKKETIFGLIDHFDRLIGAILNDPTCQLSDLLELTAAEYENQIRKYNASHAPYPKNKTIHELFKEQACKYNTSTAILFNGEAITYDQLDKSVDRLAFSLREQGVEIGAIVGVLFDRSPAFIVSILAVMKAGGAYLPIDTDLPMGRVEYIFNNSKCGFALTSDSNSKLLSDLINSENLDQHLITINVDEHDFLSEHQAEIENINVATDLAYTIYTSGTTGGPKGVMIEHRSLVNYIHWAAKTYVDGQDSHFPLFTSVSFDLTITSIFTPLLTGNRIVIYDSDDIAIKKVMEDNQVNVIKLTPSHLKIINETLTNSFASKSKVKKFIVGGEALDTSLARKIYDKFNGDIEIYNEYGPTEATVGCMTYLFDPKEDSLTVPIGFPISNAQVYLLDESFKPVSIGIYGEIFVSGDGVAKGYIFNEELTLQKFIPDPFREGQMMYRTGDVARRLSSGVLEFIRRKDEQVKINGYRVELSEVAHYLRKFDGITDALITVQKGELNNVALYAYFTTNEEKERSVNESSLRNYLAQLLPYYMVPAHFARLEEIPLTRNGKVNYASLPLANNDGKFKKPENDIETLSIEAWEKVLGNQSLSTTHNFFELGGDSIKAVQISSRLREKGVIIEVRDILTYQSIDAISPYAKRIGQTRTYEQGVIQGEFGLFPIASWFFHQNFKNPDFYNQSVLLDINDQLNTQHLEQAFTYLIEWHDELRINYNLDKNILFYNTKHLNKSFELNSFSLSDASELPFICHKLRDSFDIKTGLLIKAAIIKVKDDQDVRLFIAAHHLVIDGLSWRILLSDLYRIYKDIEAGVSIHMAQKTATLIEWFDALQSYQYATSEEKYWKDVQSLKFSIPQDFETHDWKVENLGRLGRSLEQEQTELLIKGKHNTYGTDALVLLNAALAMTLAEWTGEKVLVVEHENHGRHLEGIDASRTLGWFTALYPVLLKIEEETIPSIIKSVKEQLKRVPGQGIGYGVRAFMHGAPIRTDDLSSELRFNYLGQLDEVVNNDLFNYNSQWSGIETSRSNHFSTKLECNGIVVNGIFSLEILYNRKAHKDSTIQWLTEKFFSYLSIILDHIKNEDDLHLTPSDFETANLDQQELDALFD